MNGEQAPDPDRLRAYRIARILHAAAGALIGINVLTGWQLDRFPPEQRDVLVMLHAGFGLSILALMLVRWWWRRKHALYATVDWWRRPALLLQWVFYPLVIAQTLLGFGHALFIDYDVRAFGLFNISALADPDAALHAVLFGAHSLVAGLLLVLIIAHIADRTLQQD